MIFFVLNAFLADGRQVLGLVPVNTLIANSYVWNLLTCCFFETNVFKLCIDLLGLYHVSIGLEYDSLDNFVLYLFVCMLVCSLGASFYCFLVFFVTKHENVLVNPVYGFSGMYFTLLCYARKFKQGSSIHEELPNFTYQNVAFWVYVLQLLCYILGIKMLSRDMIFSTMSVLFSWTYLRFMYKDKNGIIGDKSEAFKFVNMFPLSVHLIVSPLSTAFYNLFVLMDLFPPLESEKKVSQHHLRSEMSLSNYIAKSSSSDVVNERRRVKAQKLLDAKMAELSKENEDWDEKNGYHI